MRFPPVFRLVSLLVLGAVVFRYSLAAQLCLAIVLGIFAATRGGDSLTSIYRALRRIRWLLLSLAVIYLLVAPEPDLAGGSRFLPGWSDLELALRRAGVLVLLVAAVELMRQTTPAPQIASAIGLLLSPFRRAGVDTERFSRRVALTLEAVPGTAEAVAAAAGRAGIRARDLSGWSEAAAELVRNIEQGATHTPPEAALPAPPSPSIADWVALLIISLFVTGLLWL